MANTTNNISNQYYGKEHVTICSKCGTPFQQIYKEQQDVWTEFKQCGVCRMAKARNAKEDIVNASIDYTPHWGQRLVHESEARFKVLNCGNRWGKDRCSIMEGIRRFCEMLNEDRSNDLVPSVHWWIIAPTMRLARQNWREIQQYFPRDLVVDMSKTDLTIKTINGGLIEIQSADDPESLVGVGLDMVTITEAARIPHFEEVWINLEARLNSPGRGPNGKGGIAIINSSPLGRNYFYKMWKWGQKEYTEYDPDWESWTFTAWDNPQMAEKGKEIFRGLTYKERLQKRTSSRLYRQNWLAEFIAEEGSQFPNADKCAVPAATVDDKVDPNEIYTIGYDPAAKADNANVVIRNLKGATIKIMKWTRMPWETQWDLLAFYSAYYNNALVVFGATGHETILSQLEKRGIPCEGVYEQGRNKEKLIEHLSILISSNWITYPDLEELLDELKDYTYKLSNKGKLTYGNASTDGHDDYVSAMAFAYKDFQMIFESAIPYMGVISTVGDSVKQEKEENQKYNLNLATEEKSTDTLLEVCIKMGHVPKDCTFKGPIILALVTAKEDPCKYCTCDCKHKRKVA